MDLLETNLRLLHAVLWLLLISMILAILVIGKDFLIPFTFAIFIWFLVNILAETFSAFSIAGRTVPKWLAYLLSIVTITIVVRGLILLISRNVTQVIRAAPLYQKNLTLLFNNLLEKAGLEDRQLVTQFITDLDIGGIITTMASNMANLAGNMVLIIIYLIFIFLEQRFFMRKIERVLQNGVSHDQLLKVIKSIDEDIRVYIGVKTFTSLLTAGISYLIMSYVNLDFAEFWALLIFVLNFIPSIGSIVATLLPCLQSLVQFETLTPFLVIFFAIGATQVLVGNILDPNLMGQRLNISPLVIVLSLLLWAVLWGVPGMFLGVPLMVMLIIVLYNFEDTRWVAQMLSKDGKMRM